MVDADAQTRNAKREDAPCATHHAPLAMGNALMCGTRRAAVSNVWVCDLRRCAMRDSNSRFRCTMLVCDAQCATRGALMRDAPMRDALTPDALMRNTFMRDTRRSATSNAWCKTRAARGADALTRNEQRKDALCAMRHAPCVMCDATMH
jgi:hypothetical protein